jgi:hypothetical protein
MIEEKEENYWPTLVDVVTSVLLIIILFMLVFVLLIVMLMKDFQENIIATQGEKQTMATPVDVTITEAKTKIADLEHENAQLISELEQMRAKQSPSTKSQNVQDVIHDKFIQIIFKDHGVTLEEEAIILLRPIIKGLIQKNPNLTLRIVIHDNWFIGSRTLSRQNSVIRVLNIRNLLLEENVKKENIAITFKDPDPKASDKGFGWIDIHYNEK